MENLKVKDIMTKTMVTVGPDDSVVYAAKLLDERRFNGLPVIDSNNSVNETNEFNNKFTTSIYINSNDAAGIKYLSIGTEKNHFIQLNAGWNLFSIPLKPSDASINAVLKSIEGKCIKIFAYNNGWRYKVLVDGQESGDLSTIEPGMGYWIYMSESASLMVTGNEILGTEINLNEGWNLIGYPSTQTDVSNVLSSINGNYDKIFTYDADGGWGYRTLNDGTWYGTLTHMVPGKGYWVHTTNGGKTLSIA